MQPWLQPMQVVCRSPRRARLGIEGSVISARVISHASQSPAAIIASAWPGSTMRPVAITGTVTAAFIDRANPVTAQWAIGEGGTIQLDPRYVEDEPSATERYSIS